MEHRVSRGSPPATCAVFQGGGLTPKLRGEGRAERGLGPFGSQFLRYFVKSLFLTNNFIDLKIIC